MTRFEWENGWRTALLCGRLKKDGLIDEVSQSTGISKKEVKDVINSALYTIKYHLLFSHEVQIHGFGKFSIKEKDAEPIRDEETGEWLNRDETIKEVYFEPSPSLHDVVKTGSL